jgi:putative transcription antitermination factor YqgF
MNYLGLDYGKKHIGVALAAGPLAEPLDTVDIVQAVKVIGQLADQHRVGGIIIGLPEGPVRSAAQNFIDQLLVLNVPVFPVDETLSSHDATASLLHTSRSRRKIRAHAAAAAIILQSWLDAHPDKL